ncbi:MAG: alcohol dehydrogenase catalytic domain-containing protein [Thermoproteota archaeon]|nr:alcohol dehydrogenase catalytic domain-containing protein [Thermoproteota archaeon]
MRSAQINKYGSSEVIEINQNTPEPTLSSGKVLVSVKAAGVNHADWKIREGGLQQLISLQFPSTLGMDFSGVIKQVGQGVYPSDFKQGDEVYGQAGVINGGSGAFAEVASASLIFNLNSFTLVGISHSINVSRISHIRRFVSPTLVAGSR